MLDDDPLGASLLELHFIGRGRHGRFVIAERDDGAVSRSCSVPRKEHVAVVMVSYPLPLVDVANVDSS